jgi:hypothetical protein
MIALRLTAAVAVAAVTVTVAPHLAAAATAPQLVDLASVSCPTTTDCIAVGSQTTISSATTEQPIARRWDGVGWHTMTVPHPNAPHLASLVSVSCPTAKFCASVGADQAKNGGPQKPIVRMWNGSTWSTKTVWSGPSGGEAALVSVSCPSTKFCLAMGTWRKNSSDQGEVWSAKWTGSAWQKISVPATSPSVLHAVSSISCPTTKSCQAVGFEGGETVLPYALTWNGSAWKTRSLASGKGAAQSELNSVSCSGADTCFGVGLEDYPVGPPTYGYDYTLLAQRFDNGAIKRSVPRAPDGASGQQYKSVSCAAAKTCVATGYYSDPSGKLHLLMHHWNGSAWTAHTAGKMPAAALTFSLPGIDCPTTSMCLAVGTYLTSDYHQHAFAQRWDGHAWHENTL